MQAHDVKEIIDCLSMERTLYPYFDGKYAFELLTLATRSNDRIRDLRGGQFAPLLEKPAVKTVLAGCGDGHLRPARLESYWDHDSSRDFLLGLSCWGDPKYRSWSQTSRSGYNLVLQLNLNSRDMAKFAALVDYPCDYNYGFHPSCRPNANRYRETLAWARLDIDFATDEALIEEVQSDFVRLVAWNETSHKDHAAVCRFVKPLQAVWQDAMLAATLQFIWSELGIATVFFHEYRTGNAMKKLGRDRPPRSIYERLPKRFCMRLTNRPPVFLSQDRLGRRILKRVRNPRFYTLPALSAK